MKLWRPRPTSPDATALRPPTGPDRKKRVEEAIPIPVEIAGQWAWRILAIVAVLIVVGMLIVSLRAIVVPFMIAMLISALLVPLKEFLIRHHWPKWLAILLALVVAAAIITGLVFIVVIQIRHGLPDIEKQTIKAYDRFQSFLAAPPFNIDKAKYTTYVDDLAASIQSSGTLGSGAKVVAETAGSLGTGLLLTIFATVFLVLDGAGIWRWVVRLFPRRVRVAVNGAGQAGWTTLKAFIRVQLLVAFVDAVFIGAGALLLHLPLAIPIAIIVFLAAFVPIVGAVVSGALAVFVALVYDDPLTALIMLIIVLGVHVVEGNFLHPFITGTAVKIHPLAIVFVVAAGAFVAHIPGALFAVPVVAVANVMILYLVRGTWRGGASIGSKDVVSGE
jgi:predicted PurR-regulated permease PerM